MNRGLNDLSVSDNVDKQLPKPWQTLDSTVLVDSAPWLKVLQHRVQLPSGRIVENYHRIEIPEYVILYVLTVDGRVIMERQYRHGVGNVTLVLPAGGIEKGELPLAAAKRELLEETGYTSDDWESLGSYVAHGNYQCGRAHIFAARDAEQVREPNSGDLEEVEIKLLKPEEVLSAVRTGKVDIMGSAMAIVLATHTWSVAEGHSK